MLCRSLAHSDENSFLSRCLQNYLRKYHYLSNTRSGNHDSTTAIKNFQKFFGLEQTGVLDDATLMQMRKPRCGVPDVDVGGGRHQRYSTIGKWLKTDLRYYQEFGNDMSHADQRRIITRAFKYWSDVAPRLKFTRVNDRGKAEFLLRLVVSICLISTQFLPD